MVAKVNITFKKIFQDALKLSRRAFFSSTLSPHPESRFSNLQNMGEASLLHATLVQSQGHCLKLVKSHQSKHNIKSKRHSPFPPDQCTYAW